MLASVAGISSCSGNCASRQLTARPYFHAGADVAGHEVVELEAVVKDNSGHPASGVGVEFFIETDDIGSAVTGADGVARHQVEVTETITGPLNHWSAQLVKQSSCVSTASYTNEP
jgi:hypothetical protein